MALLPGVTAASATSSDSAWSIFQAEGRLVARCDGRLLGRFTNVSAAVAKVAAGIEKCAAAKAQGVHPIHAAVVAVDGRAILLPGRSRAGKSSLAWGMARAGGTYFSDEFALLLPDGRVRAYPRPPRLRDLSSQPGRPRRMNDFAAATVDSCASIGLVAELAFADTGWRIRHLSAGEAAATLLRHSFQAQTMPVAVLEAAAAAVSEAAAIQGTRGEVAETVPRLMEMCRG